MTQEFDEQPVDNNIFNSYLDTNDTSKQGEIPDLRNFEIRTKLINNTSSNNQQKYPFIKMKIPKKYNSKDNTIEYEDILYDENINNINSIMEFIYKNIVISIEQDDNDQKIFSLKFYKKYYSDDEIGRTEIFKTLFFNREREFTYEFENENEIEETDNFIRDIFIDHFNFDNFSNSLSPSFNFLEHHLIFLLHHQCIFHHLK